MSEQLCRFELIYPSWLAWSILAVGAVLLLLGISRLSTRIASGTLTWPTFTVSDFFPIVLFLVGLFGVGIGAGGLAALDHQPFGRWITSHAPALLSQADEPAKSNLNGQPLSEVVPTGGSGFYSIRLSPAASRIKISGDYKDTLCDADMLAQICRNNSDKLSCDNDKQQKILRICPKGDDVPCQSHSL